jgi:predicted ATPase/class 3 adenylate cyclase
MICATCDAENGADQRFCGRCGSALSPTCPACGASNPTDFRFCGRCGTPISGTAATSAPVSEPRSQPDFERRLVSVLFADLVGFTTLSEARDAEEVRELLSRYFDTCRTLVARYGGTIEKFIGDAVMAVWGTPVATEHDAERSVRAALELTAAVSALGDEVGAPDLRARAGVLTGEAAVTIGAEGQGMVAGDLVNTASRIQSAATPGAVVVGEATRRASEAAIVYEDAGLFELKGKTEPVPLWRAVRVIGGAHGSMRSEGLEAPFVGRDRELRLIKDLFHASAEDHRAHLVSVMGIAGAGKSRVVWEFFKYIDGLAFDVRWHLGRCLPYGEGVAFWALAEMVRTRCGIVEGEDLPSASTKLHATLEEVFTDPEERRFAEPRLAVLLGIEERGTRDQEGLFAGWRLFYERLAEEMPTVLVFEDLQWADAALLDFIDYLQEWSRGYALFVVSAARPELTERRATWGAPSRSLTSIYLDPLPSDAVGAMLVQLAPELPEDARAQILERAEGVPLYAMETIRMLVDRGLLVQEGSVYRPAGQIETIEIPETLHALIAARLDGLTANERALTQDASVLGKTFTRVAIAATNGLPEPEVETLLASLVRKEVLGVQADPRSPERGQYGFLQELVKRVAYETISKRERRLKHLAAAAFIETTSDVEEEEYVEIVAAHYLEAYKLGPRPHADEADAIRTKARAMMVRAGERAASVAANAEAQRYFEQAAELADDPEEQASLLEHAGAMARQAGRAEDAAGDLERAKVLFETGGKTHPAARVAARLGEITWERGRQREALDDMDSAYRVLIDEEHDEALALLAAQLGRFLFFAGETDAAMERVEVALTISERLSLPEVLSQALITKAILLYAGKARRSEGTALLRHALDVALEHDVPSAALRSYYNLGDILCNGDRYADAHDIVRKGLALAQRVGNRYWEWALLSQIYPAALLGEWDQALEMVAAIPLERREDTRACVPSVLTNAPSILIRRGETEEAEKLVSQISEGFGESDDVQERACAAIGRACLHLARGEYSECLRSATDAFGLVDEMGPTHEAVKEAFVLAAESADALADRQKLEELLAFVAAFPPGTRSPYIEAHALRFRARTAEAAGDLVAAEQSLKSGIGLFRELSTPFWMAVSELEFGERLIGWGRPDDAGPLLEEARAVFDRLKARPWLERVDRLNVGAV